MLDGPALFKLSRGRPKELLPQIEPQECGLLACLSGPGPVGQLRLLVVQMKIPLIPAFLFGLKFIPEHRRLILVHCKVVRGF